MGSNFVRFLYHKYPHYHLVNLDLLTYAGNPDNLKDIEEREAKSPEKRYEFIRGDICDKASLDPIFQRYNFDVVVNFAAESHVDRSIVNSAQFIKTNVQGVHVLIELIREHQIPRFVQISTDEIYGDVAQGFSTEESHLRPSNPYSASKAAADLLVQAFMRTHKIPAIIVRGSNNFGPYQYPEKLIPLVISNFIDGQLVPVHGQGLHVRSWIHVLDFCSAVDIAMHEAADFSIYNASGILQRNIELIERIGKIFGKPYRHLIRYINDRPGGDLRYAVDSSKLTKEFGWEPTKSIETHLDGVIEWYHEHAPWWRKIKEKVEYKDHYERQSNAKYY